jgi:methylglutaconyl-CoA hydratase
MQDILYTTEPNGVHHITLNRTNKHNAITKLMALTLTKIIDDIANNTNSRIMILTANGTNFCAGADLNWVTDKSDNLNILAGLLTKLINLDIITMVYIQGKAIGGAIGLISTFDFAVAANNSTFQTPEISLGITPKIITPYLVRTLGMQAAKKMLLTADEMSAAEALNLTLITAIIAPDSFLKHQQNFIAATLKKDFDSIKATKKLLLKTSNNSLSMKS